MISGNFFLDNQISPDEPEKFSEIFNGKIRIEKILSSGHTTEEGKWYDQAEDEWVVLLSGIAILEFEDNSILEMKPGDYIFIPAYKKHRVTFTSKEPYCLWLAIHGNLK